MAIGNRVWAQNDQQGSEPTVYAATEDLPGGSYIGPDGFMEQRGKPTIVGRTDAAKDEEKARGLWELSEELTGVRFPLGVPATA